jgi:hypothetical protein
MAEGERNGYPHIEPLEVSDEELRNGIRRAVETDLGMSFEEFIAAYDEGTLPDTLLANELAMLWHFVELSSGVQAKS